MIKPPLPSRPPLPPADGGGGIDLSVVIPAYNEQDRIGPTLRRIRDYLARTKLRAEVLVVDDGSTDTTVQRVQGESKRLPGLKILSNGRNRGKGFSVRHGFRESRGELVLFTDADLSTPIEDLEKLLPVVRDQGYGVAIGSRAVDPSRVEVPQGWLRQHLGKGFNLIVRALTRLSILDTQCGFKLMRREALLPVFRCARVDGFSFDVEILYLAHRRGIRIAEIPVVWRNSPQSHVSILLDPLKMLWEVLTIVVKERLGRYREVS